MSPSARIVSGHAPRRAHFGVRVPSQSTSAPPTASTHAITSTVVIDGPTWLSRNRPSSFASTRNETRLASVSGRVGGLHLTAFHRLRPVEPVEVQDRRRDVDHVDEAVLARRRGAQQARREPGRAHRDRRERRAFRRRRRSHDDDRVALRVDVVEQPADERVGVAQRLGSQPRRAARRMRNDPPDRHARDRTLRRARRRGRSTPGGTHRAPGRDRGGRRTARRGRLGGDLGRRCPPGTLPCVGHQRRDRTPPVRRHPVLGCARVGAVAVGDHGPRDARLRELGRRAARPPRRRARCRSRRSRR